MSQFQVKKRLYYYNEIKNALFLPFLKSRLWQEIDILIFFRDLVFYTI